MYDSNSHINVVGCYEHLVTLDRNQMNVDRTAFVLPAFQFTLKEREICNQVDDCLSVLKVKIPSNKTELLQCMREGVCQIANARLPTHVSFKPETDM